MNQINVLISLHRGYGLGDAVQISSVLKHVAKYRPHWRVDFQAEEGRHQVGRGVCANTLAYGQPYPSPHYDAEVQIVLYDTWHAFTDRPNTRVSSCLKQWFNLPWDRECGRYQIAVSNNSMDAAQMLLRAGWGKARLVAVHYQGDSAREKKDLTDDQATQVCQAICAAGCEPIVLDWRKKSQLERFRLLRTPRDVGNDAEMVTAIISQCEAFVGIDSGPAKCASATEIPSLVVWAGHHPAPYHDPAPNTTHLVPSGFHDTEPVCGNPEVCAWFDAHYNVREYRGDPVPAVEAWLAGVLR